jgi:hypothetical protein
MTATPRKDFSTLIHKSRRRERLALTTSAGDDRLGRGPLTAHRIARGVGGDDQARWQRGGQRLRGLPC